MTAPLNVGNFQKLAFDHQQALVRLQEADERSRVLFEEIDRLNQQVDIFRSSHRTETDNRLRAEEVLDDTRDRLQLAVDAAGLVLWDFTAPFQDFFLTAKWGELLGEVALEGNWSIEQLKSRTHPDDFPAIEKGLGVLLAGYKERGNVEFRFRARDRWIWIKSYGIVAERDGDGRPIGLLGALTDISERKEREAVLADALEQADLASKAKSDFLANISHEIRTPLNALMGLNTLLLESQLTVEQRRWLELMSRSSQSLLKLLNDMLDLSRIESGKLELETVVFELRPFLNNVCELYEQQSLSKGIQFNKHFASDLPVHILGDPGRLGQVLINLLSNAIKFTPASGQVTLDVRLQGSGGDATLLLVVQDSGIGIGEEHIADVFKTFVQADASISNRFGGSGMGLAISASLLKLMSGKIRVESRVGRGSRFFVTLPLRLPTQESGFVPVPQLAPSVGSEQEAWTLRTRQFAGLTVLLADDHPVNELVMKQMLLKLGCTIKVAHDGNEAVDAWERGGIDLILMYVQMPECNGLMATERIRSLECASALSRTPIIALTANAMVGDRDRCLAAGMDAYVSKPVKMDSLLTAMRQTMMGLPSRSLGVDVREPSVRAQEPAQALVAETPQLPAGLDVDAIASDDALANEVVKGLSSVIVSDATAGMQEMQAALKSKDSRRAQAAAHRLVSTLGLIDGERAVRLCRGLEMAANAGEWNLFSRALPLLLDEVQSLIVKLER